MSFTETDHPRGQAANAGQFRAKENAAPTDELEAPQITPKTMGIIGLGPHRQNRLAEPFDAVHDERPLRPYLPLAPADDDEFFDAPAGSVVHIHVRQEDGSTSLRRFEATGSYEWAELSDRENVSAPVPAGDVWATMFADDGTMHDTILSTPVGVLYSDKDRYVIRDRIDEPLTQADVHERLDGKRARLVSRSVFGDHRDDGIPPVHQGELIVTVTDNGHITYSPIGGSRGSSRTQTLGNVFDRNGDIVIRHEQDAGYGWEEVLRPAR